MINKRNYRKTDDKKVLRKIGKQWKVVSIAVLMAIGGGAAATATHAKADNSDGVTAATQKEVNILDQKPALVNPVSLGSAATSATGQSSVASVSYLNTDGGSAASYHTRANNDRATQSSASSVMSPYVKYLNAKFPFVTSLLSSQAQSATQMERTNASQATSYTRVTKNRDAQSQVAQLASKAGMTTSDYVNSVTSETASNNASMSNALIDYRTMNSFYSIADTLFQNNYSWPSIAASVAGQAQVDRAQSQVASVQYSLAERTFLTSVSGSASVIANRERLDSYKINAIEDTALLENAEDNEWSDEQTTSSMAESLGYSDSSVTSRAIKSLADNWLNYKNQTFINDSSAVALPANVGHSAMNVVDFARIAGHLKSGDFDWTRSHSASVAFYHDVSDAAVLSSEPSAIAFADSMVASYEWVTKRNDAEVAYDHMMLKPYEINSLSTMYANSLTSEQSNATSNIALYNSDSTIPYSNRAAIHFFNDIGSGYINLAHSLGNHHEGSSVNDFKSYAQNIAELTDNAAFNNLDINYVSEHADEIKSLASDVDWTYYDNGNHDVNLSEAMSIVDRSVISNYTSTAKVSASYAKATDADVTAASYLATSYSSNASSYGREATNYEDDLDNFYLRYSDQRFAKADAAYKQAKADGDNAAALAEAFGIHVYNYGPKYVTVIHNGLLHSNPDYTATNAIMKIHAGTTFETLGVGFADDGLVRYLVNVNGRTGYFTGNPHYARQTYLTAQNNVSVKMLKTAKVYAAPNSGQYVGKTVAAGTVLPNVDVISLDHLYGGFTNLRTAADHYITANTAYAQLMLPSPKKPFEPSVGFWR